MAICLGEITTLSLAAPKKASLRTTVPMGVVKTFGLNAGDELEWTMTAKEDKLIVIVRPIKAQSSASIDEA